MCLKENNAINIKTDKDCFKYIPDELLAQSEGVEEDKRETHRYGQEERETKSDRNTKTDRKIRIEEERYRERNIRREKYR